MTVKQDKSLELWRRFKGTEAFRNLIQDASQSNNFGTMSWGKLPVVFVSNGLRGEVKPAHEPAETLDGETEFKATDQLDKAQAPLRVKSLTKYIKSPQPG